MWKTMGQGRYPERETERARRGRLDGRPLGWEVTYIMSVDKKLGQGGLREKAAKRGDGANRGKGMSKRNKKIGKWLRGRDGGKE